MRIFKDDITGTVTEISYNGHRENNRSLTVTVGGEEINLTADIGVRLKIVGGGQDFTKAVNRQLLIRLFQDLVNDPDVGED